jgi:hypothetical protein
LASGWSWRVKKSIASPWLMKASHSPATALARLSSDPAVGRTSIASAPAVSCGASSASFWPTLM